MAQISLKIFYHLENLLPRGLKWLLDDFVNCALVTSDILEVLVILERQRKKNACLGAELASNNGSISNDLLTWKM